MKTLKRVVYFIWKALFAARAAFVTARRGIRPFLGTMLIFLFLSTAVGGPFIVGALAEFIFSDAKTPLYRSPPLTTYAISQTGFDVQVIGGNGEPLSCSLPKALDLWAFYPEEQPIGLQMRQACIAHDYCYRHGNATYGYSQDDCDYRLLQDTLRLCIYISKPLPKFVRLCQQQAKKVTLGVRLAGNVAFKTTSEGSTYFEYEPFPIASQFYRAYRVAEPPGNSKSEPSKTVYVFAGSTSGLSMTIQKKPLMTKSVDSKIPPPSCTRYLLPVTRKWITTAPMVLKRRLENSNGRSEDWFVWFQRNSLTNSGSRFLAIAPGRASIEDWKVIFPGFDMDMRLNPKSERIQKNCHPDAVSIIPSKVPNTSNNSGNTYVSAIHLTGYKKEHCVKKNTKKMKATKEDKTDTKKSHTLNCLFDLDKWTAADDATENRTSEFHTAPGLEPDNGFLKLVSLRMGSCISGISQLCVSDYELPVQRETSERNTIHSFQDPLAVRDATNSVQRDLLPGRMKIEYQGEPQRYRNFQSAPFALRGKDKVSVLAWLRRGETELGKDYQDHATLRRNYHDGKRIGKSAGQVKLQNLKEENEPLVLLGRDTKNSRLFSFAMGGQIRSFGVFYWRLPRIKNFSGRDNVQISERIEMTCLDSGGNKWASDREQVEWMKRTPVVLAHQNGSGTVILSKMVAYRGDHLGLADISQTLRFKRLEISNSCTVYDIEFAQPIILPDLNKANKHRLIHETEESLLRETPLLAWPSKLKGQIEVSLPFRDNPWRKRFQYDTGLAKVEK